MRRIFLCLATLFPLAASAAPITGPPREPTRVLSWGEPALIETAVLRSTGILLNADERPRSVSQPDSERWQVEFAEYGPEGETVPVITVTPSECGLATNLLVLTTKRVYPLALRSASCDLPKGIDPQQAFDALVRFRYPDEGLKTAPVSPEPTKTHAAVSVGAPLEQLIDHASRFRWEAKKGYRGPKPVLVTEDEHSTYLVFPRGSWLAQDLPLFFLLNDKGERELANFEVEGTTFVVRSRFQQAVLVAGAGSSRKQPYLRIRRIP